MAVRYTLKELGGARADPGRPFGFYESGARLHEILRLLLGSANVYDKENRTTLELGVNELRTSGRRLYKPEKILEVIFEGAVSIEDYGRFVVAESAANLDFYTGLRDELCLSLICKKRGNNIEAFLYLYRILEYISLAVPILYASSQTRFSVANDFLKSLRMSDRDGDLAALSRAIPTISSRGNLSEVTFDFSVSGREANLVAVLRAEFDRCIKAKVDGFELYDDGDILFSVPFNSMPSLFINVRNRLFHYKIGDPNFDVRMFGGADVVCAICVKEMTHWFSLLYIEIVRIMGRRYLGGV